MFNYFILMYVFVYLIFGNIESKVVFLPQDVEDGYDHAGCTPNMSTYLAQEFKTLHPKNYIYLDLNKLRKAKVEYSYIYNQKYCRPIGEILGANKYVMMKYKLIERGHSKCSNDIYNYEIKIYNQINNTESIVFRIDSVKADLLVNKISKNKEHILSLIMQ